MAIDANVDPIGYLEEAKNRPKESSGFTPFFFAIGDGEKALVRPLLNLNHYVRVYKHEYYDNTSKTWKFRNLCATDHDLDCQACLDVDAMPESTKEEKTAKRRAKRAERMILPVYIHTVVNTKTGATVTYKDQDGTEHPVSGPRLLEMKPESSDILHDLLKTYQASESHDITKRDFKIERIGAGIDTKYETTPKDASPFSVEVAADYSRKEGVFDLYWNACPPRIVGQDAAPATTSPATNGAVKTAPDF